MEIDFIDNKLRALCERQSDAQKKLGANGAKKLRTRLADLQAVSNVLELLAGRPHELTGDRKGQYAVDLDGGRRLVFEPDHKPVPSKLDGGIDWSRVTRIRIVYIGDYHD